MKVCSRCLFVSPDKAAICMTCGGIKLREINNEGGSDDIMEGVSSSFETVFESVCNGVKSMQADCAELLPKISSAYRKMVALATVPSSGAEPMQFQQTPQRSVKSNVIELATKAKKQFVAERVSVRATVESNRSGKHRQQLPILLRNLLSEHEEASTPNDDQFASETVQEERVQSFLTEVAASNLRSMTVAEIRHELSESKIWFENYGKDGLILARPAVSQDEQLSQNAA